MVVDTTVDARFEALLSDILQLRLPSILLILEPSGDRACVLKE